MHQQEQIKAYRLPRAGASLMQGIRGGERETWVERMRVSGMGELYGGLKGKNPVHQTGPEGLDQAEAPTKRTRGRWAHEHCPPAIA